MPGCADDDGFDVAQDDIDPERELRQRRHGSSVFGGLDDVETATFQIVGNRVPRDDVAIDDENGSSRGLGGRKVGHDAV